MSMDRMFRVLVFGKAGCDKCAILKRRIGDLLARPEWSDFERVDVDVETMDGLVAFCRTEVINPNRIPAFVIQCRDEAGGYRTLETEAAEADLVGRLPFVLGMQTDYSARGRGVISPQAIRATLERAQALVAAG
jgi:hypothetical protein